MKDIMADMDKFVKGIDKLSERLKDAVHKEVSDGNTANSLQATILKRREELAKILQSMV